MSAPVLGHARTQPTSVVWRTPASPPPPAPQASAHSILTPDTKAWTNKTVAAKDRLATDRGTRLVPARTAPGPSAGAIAPAKRSAQTVKSERAGVLSPSAAARDPTSAATPTVTIKLEPGTAVRKPDRNVVPDPKRVKPGPENDGSDGRGSSGVGAKGSSSGGALAVDGDDDRKRHAPVGVKRVEAGVARAPAANSKSSGAQTGVGRKAGPAATASRKVKSSGGGGGAGGGGGEEGEAKVQRPTRSEAKLARETSTTSFAMEQNMFDLHDSVAYVAGWDEVGRGAYIGPLVSCVCVVARGAALLMNVYDSKKYNKQTKKKNRPKKADGARQTDVKPRASAAAKKRGVARERSGVAGGGGRGDAKTVEKREEAVQSGHGTVKREVGSGVEPTRDKDGAEGDGIATERDADARTEDERERVCDALLGAPGHYFRLSRREAHEIDAIGIKQAVEQVMCDAILNVRPQPDAVFVDGDILPAQLRAHPQFQAWAIVKGDSRCYTIAAASIVAKVTRDREMRRLARAYPRYDLENNVGYGSFQHEMALYTYGMTDLHRRSFNPMRSAIERGGVFFPPKSRSRGAKKQEIADAVAKVELELELELESPSKREEGKEAT
jgi:ribonuclease HII